MKSFYLGALIPLVVACNQQSGGSANLVSSEDTVSYIVGFQIGGTLKNQGAPAKPGPFSAGVNDAMTGAQPKFSPEQMRTIVTAFQTKQMDSMVTTNSAEGTKFLTENAKNEGVKTTASGLQYKAVREGRGAKPRATSQVTVHYKGMLLDGTPFDSSYGSAPVSFPLNQVIAGWTEGLQLMSPGSKYQFWIPANLAYGDEGRMPAIGPKETLAFEIELVSFK